MANHLTDAGTELALEWIANPLTVLLLPIGSLELVTHMFIFGPGVAYTEEMSVTPTVVQFNGVPTISPVSAATPN